MHFRRLSLFSNTLFAVPVLAAGALAQQPGHVWSTYLGGNGTEVAMKVKVAGDGDVVLWGFTDSSNYPTPGAFQSSYGGPLTPVQFAFGDGLIARMSSDGSGLLWSTYLGGSARDGVKDVFVGADGVITVCGVTYSGDFPTTSGAFQSSYQGRADGFVARLVWDGAQLQLIWSTLLGGTGDDTAARVVVHPSGVVVVAGATSSVGFPMAGNPFQASLAGQFDAFLAVLDDSGSRLLASTFLGGSARDVCPYTGTYFGPQVPILSLELDSAGNPVVAGITGSGNFPTTSQAFQPSFGGFYDGFVARMDLSLSRLISSTYLGGPAFDMVLDLALGTNGTVTVAGTTKSTNFPTTPGAYDRTYNGSGATPWDMGDGFVSTLDTRAPGAAQLVWSTLLGGANSDACMGVSIDSGGKLIVTGMSPSSNFPTTPGAGRSAPSGFDSVIAQLDPSKSGTEQLVYSSYLGGAALDGIYALDLDRRGNAVVVGFSESSDYPTTPGCYQSGLRGTMDVVVTKLSVLPQGAERYGVSTPACLRPIYQGVNSWPVHGNLGFTLEATGAGANAAGALFFGQRATAYPFFNLEGLVTLGLPGEMVAANHQGSAEFNLSIPATISPGGQIAAQWVFLTMGQCPGTGPLSSSEGLELTVQ